MAFESLSEKFSNIFKKIRGQSRLTENNIEDILKEVKIALLEADVNYKVVKEFINDIKEKAIGQDVIGKLNPSETVLKIVKDKIVDLFTAKDNDLKISDNRLTIFMMVGLQGSGKTTTTAKIANLLKTKNKKKVLLAACDVYRPAAIEQLKQLANSIQVDLFELGVDENPVNIALQAREKAIIGGYDVLIIDTAGRLQIDEKLMDELKNLKSELNPDEILLLTDAMAGQDSVNVAQAFNETLGLSGIVMSKMDGDSRGGAALSITKISKVPIKFICTGEKVEDIDIFYPERMAERILGMGDVMTLIDKVNENIDEKEARKKMNKLSSGNFTLLDMLDQMRQVKKMGSLGGLIKLIPGAPKISDEQLKMAEKEMKTFEVIINSMTNEEKMHPEILKNSRKIRIANGSGKTSADINRVLKKYEQSKEMMKKFNSYKKGGKLPPDFNRFL